MQQQKSRGFALLDVFLAVIILVVITVGSYQLMSVYRNTSNVQTVQNEVMSISLAYAPLLNQTAIQYTGTPILNNGQMLTCFLLGVPLPKERLTDTDGNPCTDNSYSYVKTSLNGNASLGFATLSTTASGSTPVQQYFVAGVKASCTQIVQIIQMMNNSFGLFYGNGSLRNSSSADTAGLPNCKDGGKTYNIYFVSPKINDNAAFTDNDFTAP